MTKHVTIATALIYDEIFQTNFSNLRIVIPLFAFERYRDVLFVRNSRVFSRRIIPPFIGDAFGNIILLFRQDVKQCQVFPHGFRMNA
jgi:hypothetical protein